MTDQAHDEQYYSPKEVARRLEVEPETVRRWIRRGLLPAFELPGGGGYRVPRGAITAMLVRQPTAQK